LAQGEHKVLFVALLLEMTFAAFFQYMGNAPDVDFSIHRLGCREHRYRWLYIRNVLWRPMDSLHYQAKKSENKRKYSPSAGLIILVFSTVMLILFTAVVFGYLNPPDSEPLRGWDLFQTSILWGVIIYGTFVIVFSFLLFIWVASLHELVGYFMALIHGARKDRAERQ
jgi:hypothetical protein